MSQDCSTSTIRLLTAREEKRRYFSYDEKTVEVETEVFFSYLNPKLQPDNVLWVGWWFFSEIIFMLTDFAAQCTTSLQK